MIYKPSVYMGRNNLIELWFAIGCFFLVSAYACGLSYMVDLEECHTSTNLKPGISAEECYDIASNGKLTLNLFAIAIATIACSVGLYYSKRAYIKCD